jgi:hypothetical protein
MGCETCQSQKLDIILVGSTGELKISIQQLLPFLTSGDVNDLITFIGGQGSYIIDNSIYLPTGQTLLDAVQIGFDYQNNPLQFIMFLELNTESVNASDVSLQTFLNNEMMAQGFEWMTPDEEESPDSDCGL